MKTSTTLKALLIVMIGLSTIACEPSRNSNDSAELANEANDEKYDDRKDEKDAEFVVNTIAANYAEIELAKMAIERSQDEEVKSIARKLEEDHTAIIRELKSYAERRGISVPVAASDDFQNDQEKLAEKNTDEFDEELCEMLVKKHKETIDEFEKREDKTEDPELKSWISNTLPTLKSHLNSLEQHENRENNEL